MNNITNTLVPTVYEDDKRGFRTHYDIYSRLLKDRIIFITGPVEAQMANIIIAQMIFLERENSKEDIQMYIQSPGGSVPAGLAIYDAMQYVKPNIVTIGMGSVASMGSILLAAGTKGKRMILPHARVMIHQVSVEGFPRMTAAEVKVQNKEMQENNRIGNEILARHTGQSIKKLEKDTSIDYWMSAEETKKYGLVDKVLS